MIQSRARLFAFYLILVGVVPISAGEFPASLTWDTKPDDRAQHAALEGKPMPALDLSEWINGEVKLADLKGKVVVLDFYATWCGPCMAAIPHNNQMLKQYQDKGLIIIGICTSNRGQGKMAANARENSIQYPIARDANLKSAKAWEVNYYPTYALVDRKGIVRVVGLQPKHVENVVKKLLSERVP